MHETRSPVILEAGFRFVVRRYTVCFELHKRLESLDDKSISNWLLHNLYLYRSRKLAFLFVRLFAFLFAILFAILSLVQISVWFAILCAILFSVPSLTLIEI